MNHEAIRKYVANTWQESITPELIEYIKIPALSPDFDADWQAHGHIDRAIAQVKAWCEKQPIENLSLEVVRLEGRTPVLFMEIAPFGFSQPSDAPTVLLYGHLDKQPEMQGWDADKGPWKPVRIGDKLYGRGGADDGYAAFGSLTAIAALQKEGVAHGRCVVLIETSEESGSCDLPAYIDALTDRIGTPELVICLDSGCGNYEQLWSTTSLRGLVNGVLTVRVLQMGDDESPSGVHSGNGGGVVPSSFRILRQLLERIEDHASGAIKLDALNIAVPEQRVEQAKAAAAALGEQLWSGFAWSGETKPLADGHELVLGRTWRPCLEVVGMGGVPNLRGGNVLRAHTSAKLSVRLPPTVDGEKARKQIQALLEQDPPHGATVTFKSEHGDTGWNAPPVAPWLDTALQEASQAVFDKPAVYMGEGGSIPFMGMLGEKFPDAQFVITGVLGPESNAHGPNEFIHLAYAERVTNCIALILAKHCEQRP